MLKLIETLKERIYKHKQRKDDYAIMKLDSKTRNRKYEPLIDNPCYISKDGKYSITHYVNNKGIHTVKEKIAEPKPFISPFMKID